MEDLTEICKTIPRTLNCPSSMPPQSLQNQLYLQAMRPSGQDAAQPEMVEAMRAAEQDPVLGDWLAKEQAFDRSFAAHLATVQPPAHLQATILAGVRASRQAKGRRTKVWRVLAAAAAVALLAGIGYRELSPRPLIEPPLAQFRHEMIQTLESVHALDHKSARADEVKQWLAEHQGIADAGIPVGLSERETIGCKLFEWHGAQVTLICFRPCPSGDPQSASAHLFVVDEKDAPELLNAFRAQAPAFAESNAWTSAVWQREGKIHLLISRSAMPHLQGLFAGG
jgi:hypothetical protein